MYPKSDCKKEGRIGSFRYIFYAYLWAEKQPKYWDNFGTKTEIIFIPALSLMARMYEYTYIHTYIYYTAHRMYWHSAG